MVEPGGIVYTFIGKDNGLAARIAHIFNTSLLELACPSRDATYQ